MSWTTDRIDLKDNQTKTRRIDLNKFTLGLVRRGKFQYILIRNSYKYTLDYYSAFFYLFLIPYPWRVSYIIQFLLDYLNPTLVDYLSHYLSVCPIRHFLWLSMSCGSQCSTVQEFSSHKCNQKSSYSIFNTVAAALSQVFPSSYSSSMFVMLASQQWSFLKGHFELQDMHSICAWFIQGDIPPRNTFPNFST